MKTLLDAIFCELRCFPLAWSKVLKPLSPIKFLFYLYINQVLFLKLLDLAGDLCFFFPGVTQRPQAAEMLNACKLFCSFQNILPLYLNNVRETHRKRVSQVHSLSTQPQACHKFIWANIKKVKGVSETMLPQNAHFKLEGRNRRV